MSSPSVLALNPGSSSVKAALYTPTRQLSVRVDRLGTARARLTRVRGSVAEEVAFGGGLAEALDAVAWELDALGVRPDLVAHRVVHGGPHHYRPTVVGEELLVDLHLAVPLAPLHQPEGLESIAHARRTWPDAVHVACFDTGFHHDLPEVSRRLPVPVELERCGVRRYGFHGLSLESVLHARRDLGDTVIAHLGSGCSVTAVGADGRPRHTSMSLTPTGGMMSATRAGDLDPQIVLYLLDRHGYTVGTLLNLMDRHCGLAGLAGGRHDVRDLLSAPDAEAEFAVDALVRSAAAAIAGCASSLGGWDTLVFTGGVGEHCAAVREGVCGRLLAVRSSAPDTPGGSNPVDRLASTGVRVLVVPADEEGVLARAAGQFRTDMGLESLSGGSSGM